MPENNTVVESTQTQTNAANKPQVRIPDFGAGRYSNLMKETFADCKRELGFSERESEKVARTIGADIGRLNMNASLKLGNKLGKDGTLTVQEVAKMKGVTLTYAISVVKTLNTIQELKKFGLKGLNERPTFSDEIESWLSKE